MHTKTWKGIYQHVVKTLQKIQILTDAGPISHSPASIEVCFTLQNFTQKSHNV